jgi:hypothetical protein
MRVAPRVDLAMHPPVKRGIFAAGVFAQAVDELSHRAFAQQVQVEVDAELQHSPPDVLVLLADSPRLLGALAGKGRQHRGFLFGQVPEKVALELAPSRAQRKRVALLGTGHQRLEQPLQTAVIIECWCHAESCVQAQDRQAGCRDEP